MLCSLDVYARWGSCLSVDESRVGRHASGAGCVTGYARLIINNEFVVYRMKRMDRESSELYKVLKTIDKKKTDYGSH